MTSRTSEKPECPPEVRAWYSKIGKMGGGINMSREKRSYMAKLTSKEAWRKRRARYGRQGYDRSKIKRWTKRMVMEQICAAHPELWNHPVWKES